MSVSETDKVDIVAARPGSSVVKLVIADHLSWEDFEAHARVLQDKINTYIEFIDSGQLQTLQSPKIPDDPELHIALVLQYPPSDAAGQFLAKVHGFLADMGLAFDVEVAGPA